MNTPRVGGFREWLKNVSDLQVEACLKDMSYGAMSRVDGVEVYRSAYASGWTVQGVYCRTAADAVDELRKSLRGVK